MHFARLSTVWACLVVVGCAGHVDAPSGGFAPDDGSTAGTAPARGTPSEASIGLPSGAAAAAAQPGDGVVVHLVQNGPSITPDFFEIAVGMQDVYLRGRDLWRVPRTGGTPERIVAPTGLWEKVVANDSGAVASTYDGTNANVYRVDGAATTLLDAPVGTGHRFPMWIALDGSTVAMRITTLFASAPPDSYSAMPLFGGAPSAVYDLPASLSSYWNAIVDSSIWIVERRGNASFDIARVPVSGAGVAVAPLAFPSVLATAGFGGRLYVASPGAETGDVAISSIDRDGAVRSEGTALAADAPQGTNLTVNASGIYLGNGKALLRLTAVGVAPAITPADGFRLDAVGFTEDGATVYWSESKATCTQTTTGSVEGEPQQVCTNYESETFVRARATTH